LAIVFNYKKISQIISARFNMKRILFMVLIIFSGISLYAGDHSFSVNFELTQTAINRALA